MLPAGSQAPSATSAHLRSGPLLGDLPKPGHRADEACTGAVAGVPDRWRSIWLGAEERLDLRVHEVRPSSGREVSVPLRPHGIQHSAAQLQQAEVDEGVEHEEDKLHSCARHLLWEIGL